MMEFFAPSVVENCHPPFVNQHKGEAGNESPQQVGERHSSF